MMAMIILYVLTIAIFWKLYRKQVKDVIGRITGHFEMKSIMKRLEGKVYYDTDEAQQDMMVFNKMFWGVYGYTHPKLYKNNVDDLWIIRF